MTSTGQKIANYNGNDHNDRSRTKTGDAPKVNYTKIYAIQREEIFVWFKSIYQARPNYNIGLQNDIGVRSNNHNDNI